MIDTSSEWREAHQEKVLPETFVEITMTVEDDITGQWEYVRVHDSAVFRNSVPIVHRLEVLPPAYYATLEENLWVLDGTRRILPDPATGGESAGDYYNNTGWVSHDVDSNQIHVEFKEIHKSVTPGFTITWSSEYNEYPKKCNIEIYRGDTLIQTLSRKKNRSNVTEFYDVGAVNYDKVSITWSEWNFPNHRSRIDQIYFGNIRVFDKDDIISYTHEQSGDLLSAALPKNSISFSVNNIDGEWNFNNPSGVGKYLVERQKLTVRYGMDIEGKTEWIPGGVFYLSEWDTPANGLEAHFVARDIFEFFLNTPSTNYSGLTLSNLVSQIIVESGLPDDIWVYADSSIATKEWEFEGDKGVAESLQLIANRYRCVFRQDRQGDVHIMPLDKTLSSYPMLLDFAYSYPEITLSKPLKEVVVNYAKEQPYVLSVDTKGESQTVTNKTILTENGAISVAKWVRDTLKSRKTVSGEFRADPRLDVYDIVEIESKYGTITPVAITNIKYTYNGSFRGSYEGRVIDISEVE